MTNLSRAFKELRKKGIIAQQRYLCCRTCASYTIATELKKHLDSGDKIPEKIIGAMFYTLQDAERLRKDNKLWISFGPIQIEGYGEVGVNVDLLGRIICEEFENHERKAIWNGDPDVRILIEGDSIHELTTSALKAQACSPVPSPGA